MLKDMSYCMRHWLQWLSLYLTLPVAAVRLILTVVDCSDSIVGLLLAL